MQSTHAHDRVATLEMLLGIARRLAATVDLDELLATIVEAATALLDCERATVFLYDKTAHVLWSRVATGMPDGPMSAIRFPAGRGIAGEVARTGRLINIPDAYADARFNPDIDRVSGYRTRSILAVRLADHDDGTVGVLQLLNKRGRSFTDGDEEIAGFLGSQAGVAIQRQQLLDHFAEKQRIERDLDIARDIQLGLLPRDPPVLKGYEIAGWNRPADATGGDFFDFIPLADGCLAVVVADVTGHGMGPALVMAEARALFRAVLHERAELNRVVTSVHRLLALDIPAGRFVTAFCGLACESGNFSYLSAGQGPILWHEAATGTVRELPTQGLPLAFIPDVDYEGSVRIQLAPGDVLAVLTDGFYEWGRPDGDVFGIERVADAVRRHHHLPAREIIAALTSEVVAFAAGSPQSDDLTAVIVKREGF